METPAPPTPATERFGVYYIPPVVMDGVNGSYGICPLITVICPHCTTLSMCEPRNDVMLESVHSLAIQKFTAPPYNMITRIWLPAVMPSVSPLPIWQPVYPPPPPVVPEPVQQPVTIPPFHETTVMYNYKPWDQKSPKKKYSQLRFFSARGVHSADGIQILEETPETPANDTNHISPPRTPLFPALDTDLLNDLRSSSSGYSGLADMLLQPPPLSPPHDLLCREELSTPQNPTGILSNTTPSTPELSDHPQPAESPVSVKKNRVTKSKSRPYNRKLYDKLRRPPKRKHKRYCITNTDIAAMYSTKI